MRFLDKAQVRPVFEGRSVAIVGSGPSSLANDPGFVDSHDVVVRVNNYVLRGGTGRRTDVYYSFFGGSIRKTRDDLRADGVTLCMCKCPNAQPIESEWHRVNRKMTGVDFRWIYRLRESWWFCDTYVPSVADFLTTFELLDRHVPTTGFATIMDVLSFDPRSAYLTGFDFFRSGIHNLDQPWRRKNSDDPIGHVPERELGYLAAQIGRLPISFDPVLEDAIRSVL